MSPCVRMFVSLTRSTHRLTPEARCVDDAGLPSSGAAAYHPPMRNWIHNVWQAIATVWQGMAVTLKTATKTYTTRETSAEVSEYPEKPLEAKPRYRGFHRFDLTTCIACEKCLVACPVDCIYIDRKKATLGKGFQVDEFSIDYSKCLMCALCVDPCPVDCIFMGASHDLSTYTRDGTIVDFAKLPPEIAWGRSTLNPTAVAQSKHIDQPAWVRGEEQTLWPPGMEAGVSLEATKALEKAAEGAASRKSSETSP